MPTSKPTVVLVHGAWHDERCWAQVLTELRHRRIPAATLTLPSTDPGRELPGFADDVAAVIGLIESLGGQVVLCGHAYGGMVISEAGHHDRVTRLVYLAAYCPRPGERVVDQVRRPGHALMAPLVHHTGDGRMVISARSAARKLYGDLQAPVAASRAAQLLPSTAAIYRTPVVHPAWLEKPSTYIIGRRDRALDARRSRAMAQLLVRARNWGGRAPATALTLDTGHCPFYSAPKLVADIASGCSAWL
jgi:pimeloyl-ACP methyl ester carboxylesterase